MKKLIPAIIALVGLGGGLAAGAIMKPEPAVEMAAGEGDLGADGENHAEAKTHSPDDGGHKADTGGHGSSGDSHGDSADAHNGNEMIYVGLEKPFFVPVLRKGKKNTLVRLDIHLEVPQSLEESITKHDPKLRDAFLQTVMNFSHEGGFTRVHGGEGFSILRDDLLVSARKILGPQVKTVLIGEILTREG